MIFIMNKLYKGTRCRKMTILEGTMVCYSMANQLTCLGFHFLINSHMRVHQRMTCEDKALCSAPLVQKTPYYCSKGNEMSWPISGCETMLQGTCHCC